MPMRFREGDDAGQCALTWYIEPMDAARLHFPGTDTEPLPLLPGTHLVGFEGEHLGAVAELRQALLSLQVERGDIWLHVVAHTATCVHVNGRRVHQIALLRSGDVVHVDAAELRLVTLPPRPHTPGQASGQGPHDLCWVLRGLSGQHHGRCFTLDRPRWVGRGTSADIQIDEPTWAECQIRLERDHEQILLHNPGAADDSVVNGCPRCDAVLAAGDQLVLGRRHRFVLEVPQTNAPALPPFDGRATAPRRLPASPARTSWPLWLLAAAALLAAALSGLLLFGAAM